MQFQAPRSNSVVKPEDKGHALPIVGTHGIWCTRVSTLGRSSLPRRTSNARNGRQVAITGPTGREPLVGFRLRIEEVGIPLQPELEPTPRTKSAGRVRVFRSHADQSYRLRSTWGSFCQ